MNDTEGFLLQLAEATAAGIVRWERLSRGVWGTGKDGRTIMYRPGDEAYLLVAGDDGRQTLSLPRSNGTQALDLVLREREEEAEALKRGVGAALAARGIGDADDIVEHAIRQTESGKLRWSREPYAFTAVMKFGPFARVALDAAPGLMLTMTLRRPWSSGGVTFERLSTIPDSPPARLADIASTSTISMPK